MIEVFVTLLQFVILFNEDLHSVLSQFCIIT